MCIRHTHTANKPATPRPLPPRPHHKHTTSGLDDRTITGPALLEADQGDTISGKVSRDEAAQAVAAALSRPDAAFKTFELRQSEAADAAGKSMSEAAFTRLFLKLSLGELALLMTACR